MKLALKIDNAEIISIISGPKDRNLLLFKQQLGLDVTIFKDGIITSGTEQDRELLEKIFQTFITLAENKIEINEKDVMHVINLAIKGELGDVINLYKNRHHILINNYGKAINAKTFNQQVYVNAIRDNNLTFGVGPAGTGKTYLAVVRQSQL